MKTKNLFTVAAVSAGLAFGVTAQANEEKHEEQTINSSDVPAAVQSSCSGSKPKAEQLFAGKRKAPTLKPLLRRMASRSAFEIDANGKVLSKHNEAKEHKEKGEKY